MLKASITLGVIGMVVTFLVAVLGAFPLSSGASNADIYPNDDNANSVERAGDMMLSSYTDIINDLVSFQDNPSLERAEARKNAFINYAQNTEERFKVFHQTLGSKMDELTQMDPAETE